MKPWLVAARPATLLAAMSPVAVGSSLAYADDAFRWDAGLVALAGALLIQIGVNFANDAADASRGADTASRIGPPRAVASGMLTARAVWTGTGVVFAAAAGCGVYLAAISGWPVLAIGAASLAAAVAYTSGPAYGYHGLGEVFVFVFFGLVATAGTRYVHDSTVPAAAWVMAIPVGLLITAILVVNNIRDIETDRAAGKKTLAVLLGRRPSAWLLVGLVAAAFTVTVAAAVGGLIPGPAAAAVAVAPLAVAPLRLVFVEDTGPPLIAALQGTARMQFAFAAVAAAGIAAGRAL